MMNPIEYKIKLKSNFQRMHFKHRKEDEIGFVGEDQHPSSVEDREVTLTADGQQMVSHRWWQMVNTWYVTDDDGK